MKKLFTKLTAIIAVLLLSAGSVSAQTTITIFQETFNNLTTVNTTGNALAGGNTDQTDYVVGGGGSSMLCSEDGTMNLTGGRFATKNLDLTGDGVTLFVRYKLKTTTTAKFQIDIDKTGTSGMGGILNESGGSSPTDFQTKSFVLTTGTASSYIHFRTESNHTIVIDEIKITKNVSSPSITAFTAAGIAATINESAKTITAELPYGTNLTSIEPVVTVGGTATSYSPTGAQDFSAGAVNYIATDGTPENDVTYAVTLTASTVASSDKDLSDVTIGGFTPAFNSETNTYSVVLPKASSFSQAVVFTKPVTATANFTSGDLHDFTSPLSITVTAQDETQKVYALQVTVGTKNIAYVTLATGNDDPYLFGSLVSKGYYVEKVIADAQAVSFYDSFDLAILFDVVGSSSTCALNMGGLIGSKRFLNLKAYMYGKAGWPTGGGANFTDPDAKQAATVLTDYVSHPIFTGLTFTNSDVTLVDAGGTYRALQGVTTPGSGAAIATVIDNPTAANIIEENTNESAMYLMIGLANGGATYGLSNISADGKMLLDNAVAYLLSDAKYIPVSTSVTAPVASDITFDGRIIRNNDRQELLVFNSTGRLVARSTNDISMASQPKGVYFVKSNNATIKIALTK
jgi:hypothetical protein